MPDEIKTPKKPDAKVAFTPFAYSDRGLRPAMIEHLKLFKPEGNPDPAQLAPAITFAISQVTALAAEYNAVQVNIEAQVNPRTRQTNVIVIGENIRV